MSDRAHSPQTDGHQVPSVPQAGDPLWRRLLPPVVAMLATAGVALSRLLVNPAFYFVDDSQSGTAGQWWRLGELLETGRLPILDVHAWTAGNYFAEGQWGLFNPAVWAIALFSRAVADPLVYVTAVKIIALVAMALGTYLLARTFGATRPWASAAGILAPLGGFTVYMDAPSWTTGLLVSATLPWAWWGLRRLVEDGRGPLGYLLASALLVTFGYVFGVIVLVLILGESLLRSIFRRDRRAVLTTLGAGTVAALLTLAVYLPGVLTASVTVRDSTAVVNTGFLNADLTDMLSASTATVTASVGAWWGEATSAPLVYALWALPALALFRPARDALRRLVPLLVVGSILLVIVTGPDQIGPIRWPVRFMPYLVIVAAVAFAAIASGMRPGRSPRWSLAGALGIVLITVMFSVGNTPWQWRQSAISAVVQTIGIVLVWWLLNRRVRRIRDAGAAAAAVTAAVGAVLVIPQMYYFPASPLPQLGVVTDTRAMAAVPGDVPDDVIVVGDIYAGWRDPATYDERLVANQWYFSDAAVSSLYTVLPHRAYVEDLCADLRGSTCDDALVTLASTDATTGEEVATLLGVNAMVVMKSSFPEGAPGIPAGWRLAEDGDHTWLLVRDDPVPTAGGVVWESDGTRVVALRTSDDEIALEVESVGAGARVVLSRLAWPGYSVAGAALADSTRGYLLTLDLDGASPGDVVTVTFRPPGWGIEIASVVIAVIAIVGWPFTAAVLRRRRERASGVGGDSVPADPSA